jgi:hypothetical protein
MAALSLKKYLNGWKMKREVCSVIFLKVLPC